MSSNYTNEENLLEGDNGGFIGREEEREKFRLLLREYAVARKGFFGSLMGSPRPKNKNEKQPEIQSRVMVINGEAGSGKTRLALQLRQIALKEREFKGKFRVSRLEWQEAMGRDQRVAGLNTHLPIPAEVALDMFNTHFIRDDFEGQFEEYRAAVEQTRQLAKTVSGAELTAVWEFRGRALGRGMRQVAQEKPLVFILDNFVGSAALNEVVGTMLEESGGQVSWIIIGTDLPPNFDTAEGHYLNFELKPFSEDELLRCLQVEFTRYQEDSGLELEIPEYRSPDKIAWLQKVTGGLPLTTRLAAFLLHSGLTVEDLPEPEKDKVSGLLKLFLTEPLGPGHPDRLKLYTLASLRRPEKGLLAAILDLRQDMLSSDEIILLMQSRYSFLFEPGQPMALHPLVSGPLRSWLLEPAQRQEENGLARVNNRAIDFLWERLRDWGQNFTNLPTRIRDVKWSNWALDLAWHSFWLDEQLGWREILPLFIAGLEYKPTVATTIVTAIEQLADIGAIGDTAESKAQVALLQKLAATPTDKTLWQELNKLGIADGWFDQRWPQFAAQFEFIVEEKLKLN